MSSTVRRANHAGSWYTVNGPKLNSELSGWLSNVDSELESTKSPDYRPPIQGCKAIIAPHAGYSYSGPTAAWAYKSIDTTRIRRVFVLGPSHHVYLDGCALSVCQTYKTPVGDLPLDLETIAELRSTGQFSDMDVETDEDEHSLEMHLPYVRKVFEGKDIVVVPIMVGAIDVDKERQFGRMLAPYLAREDTLFVISSDFCHWGQRFSYTFYYPSPLPDGSAGGRRVRSSSDLQSTHPIHASISDLDHEAMGILSLDPSENATKTVDEAHGQFDAYLNRTKNTICGRHPIGVLLGAMAGIQESEPERKPTLQWVRYAQSSACLTFRDSSVSYASAYVVM